MIAIMTLQRFSNQIEDFILEFDHNNELLFLNQEIPGFAQSLFKLDINF